MNHRHRSGGSAPGIPSRGKLRTAVWALPLFAGSTACNPEHEITEIPIDEVAVTTGDYDRVEEALTRLLVGQTPYEGYISGAAYDHDIDPDMMTLKVESLLPVEEELELYGALFVNSGTRGLGAWVYNGVEADDSLVTDDAVLENVTSFVDRGGVLVASDWAYDLLEACWPDRVDWGGDDEVLDDAQRGTMGTVAAEVIDPALVEDLGEDQVSIEYDYSWWAVPESVQQDVDVYLQGDVTWRAAEDETEVAIENVPLLFSFEEGRGMVLFSTFHWRTQRTSVADTLLSSLVEGLKSSDEEGDIADTGEASDTGGEAR